MKRLISLLLSLMLVLTMLPVQVFAADEGDASLLKAAPALSVPHGYEYQKLAEMGNGTNLTGAYDAIYTGVAKLEERIDLEEFSLTADEAKLAYYTCRNASPELFWMRGGFSYSVSGNSVVSISDFANSPTQEEREAFAAGIEKLTNGVLADDRAVALAVHDRLIDHVEYIETSHAHDAYGAIVEGKAVCEGYARAYQLLMHRMGLECLIVTGFSNNPVTGSPEGHAWNMVKLDENWVQVDTTWDDQGEQAFHAYFACTDAQMAADHKTEDMGYSLPVCSDAGYRCFTVAQGNYFVELTVEGVAALLKKNINDNKAYCEFEYTGGPATFGTWLNENLGAIGKELGITSGTIGTIGAGQTVLGNEYHLTITGNIPHRHVYDRQNTDAKYLKSAATCTEPAVYYLSCSCGAKGTKTFTVGEALGHDFSKEYTTDGSGHWYACQRPGCSEVTGYGAHEGGEASCTQQAVCAVCGVPYGELAPHACGEDWNSNETDHWHDCEFCKNKVDSAKHTPDGNTDCEKATYCSVCSLVLKEAGEHTWNTGKVTKAATFKAEGEMLYTCSVCKATKTEPIPALIPELKSITATATGMYSVGDSKYDGDHITVTALLTDGSKVDVTGLCSFSDFDSSTSGTKKVTVTYEDPEGIVKTTTVSVTVKAVSKLTVKTMPDKIGYVCGDELDPTGLVLEATFSDKSTEILSAEDYELTGFESAKTGAKTVKVTYSYGGKAVSTTFKVNVVKPVASIALNEEAVSLAAGKSITLKATVAPADATNKKVEWVSDDPTVASVSTSGAIKAVKPGTATIYCRSTDGFDAEAICTVTVTPVATEVIIYANGEVMTGGTIPINLSGAPGDIVFTARVLPFNDSDPTQGVSQKVNWTSSDKTVFVNEDGVLEINTPVTKAKTVTLTATTTDGSNKKATVKISFAYLVDSITITGSDSVAVGKSIKLNAVLSTGVTDAKGKAIAPTNSKVTWESSDPSVATVSGGTVKANAKLTTQETVTITVKATDGSDLEKTWDVTVYPATTSVEIFHEGDNVTKDTISLNLTAVEADATIVATLTAATYPTGTCGKVAWKSSDKTVVIDAEGNISLTEMPAKAKKVTITATAADGTNKSATVTLNLYYLTKSIELSGSNSVAVGKSIKLNAVLSTGQFDAKGKAIAPTNSKVTWESSDPSVATVSGGTVKANAKLTTQETVTITVKATDGSDLEETWDVTVYPATTSVVISCDGEAKANAATVEKSLTGLSVGDTIATLTAATYPTGTCGKVTWKSGNVKVAAIDENGVITLVGSLTKPTTVTFTATAADGTGKTATLKLKLIP